MRNDSPLNRQWLLLRTLAARHYGISVQELAQELGVVQRTVRRDLETLRTSGFPLEERVVEHGKKFWFVKPSSSGPGISFSLDEALALYVGRRFLEPLAGTLLWEAARGAFNKVRATLNAKAVAYLDRMAGSLHLTAPGQSDYARHSEIVDALMEGIESRHVTHVAYRSLKATEPVTYELEPLGLVHHHGSLYLVAFSREHHEVRHFKVDRMTEAEASRFPFQRPEAFDLATHLKTSFGIYQGTGDIVVTVRFLPPVVRYVEESIWHATQQLFPQPDGALHATFRLSSTTEISRWLLSFGQHAQVLSPDSLRQELQQEARALLAAYSMSPSPLGRGQGEGLEGKQVVGALDNGQSRSVRKKAPPKQKPLRRTPPK